MGRNANPIILKHYTRGNKIDNSSNRYQWTCKHCGEHFAKGRTDGLYNHISKKCTALSMAEKSNLALQILELGLAAQAANAKRRKGRSADTKESDEALSISPEGFNRLNMLAEVSRQAVESQHGGPSRFISGDNVAHKALVLDPALENQGLRGRLSNGMDNHMKTGRRMGFCPVSN
jgi:hypothetical protein